MLAAVQDGATRQVLIPGFYDAVKALTARQRAYLDGLPITDAVGLAVSGAPALGGEPAYPLKERISARPTFEVHGIVGGYTGPGTKTVIPAEATAKISFRLVPDQRPGEVFEQAKAFFTSVAPPTVRVTCTLLGAAEPVTVDLDEPVVRAADAAYRATWGVPPCYIRGGGSLPVADMFMRHVSPAILLTGFGLPEDREHAPNESISLRQFTRGIEFMVRYFDLYRELAA
jgi:acetylornithine deacetylase/succinyl-diaminopimelate desuccinylase-like protein